VLSGTRTVSPVNAGATTATTSTPHVQFATPLGTYFVCATADGNSTVTERNETNNGLCSTGTVQVTQ
jgi:hypothetical protein